MEQNKTSKYFKYALGEIILVVIGILIALQINNWNEHRKKLDFENDITSLLYQNLEQDSIALATLLFDAKRATRLTDSLLKQVAEGNYGKNLNQWMGTIICFERFKSQSSAYEVLKSKGIEIISDNELQLALISFYDENLYRLYESINDVELSFKTDWMPVLKTQFVDFKWNSYCTPIDSEAFFTNPSTVILFKLFKDNRDGEVERLEKALTKITDIRKQIKRRYK